MRVMRDLAVAVVAAFVFAASACGIDAVGTMPAAETQSLPDAAVGAEVGVRDSGTCRSITTGTPGSLVARKVASAPSIDGDLSDWDTCFFAIDRNNAYSVRDIAGTGAYPSGEFSVVHDGAKIYVAVRMAKVDALGGATGTSLFLNDAAEIYFDTDGVLAQDYTSDAMQIIVDHTGKHQGFRNQATVDTPLVKSAALSAGEKITIELEVTPSTFGRTTFANPIGFDVALDNGDGSNQLTQIVWFQKCRKSSGCGCTDGNDSPYCDGRQFGSLMLEP